MKKVRVGDFSLPVAKPKQKPFLKVSGILLSLTAVVAVWLMHEVGLLGFTRLSAADKPATSLETLQRSVQDREKAMKDKEEALARKEAALVDREAALADQIRQFEKTVEENEKTVKDLRSRLSANEQKAEDRPDEFLSIYEKMEAKRAAKIFEKLDLPLATRLLRKMTPSRAAEILGLMPSDRARLLTERHLARTADTAAVRDTISGQ